ncbi:hypothetical protein AHAS_Ahas08G0045400 [Arachis hypogaea]
MSSRPSRSLVRLWFSPARFNSVVDFSHRRRSRTFTLIDVFLLRLCSLSLSRSSVTVTILDSDPLIKPWQIPHPIQSIMTFADIFLGSTAYFFFC